MEINKPLKRVSELRFLSREHHYSLLLSWKIRSGLSKKIEIFRIKKYVDWFYNNHVKSHFKMEEQYVFPILGNNHELVKKAISEHKRLTKLFAMKEDVEKSLILIEEELMRHIRFDERILFKEIQEVATVQQLEMIDKIHTTEKFIDNMDDPFWK